MFNILIYATVLIILIVLTRYVGRIAGILSILLIHVVFLSSAAQAIGLNTGGYHYLASDTTSTILTIREGCNRTTELVTFITTAVLNYGGDYLGFDVHFPRYNIYILIFEFFMDLYLESDDYLLLFTGWEGIGIMSFFLVSYYYVQPKAVKCANKAVFMNRFGDVGLLYVLSAHVDLSYALKTIGFTLPLYSLIIPAISAKSAQVILHTWLPDAMAAPTTVSSLLHAATMVTSGTLLLSATLPSILVSFICSIIGITSVLLGSTIALSVRDVKRIIAFSTMSQIAIILLGFTINSSEAIYHLYTHAYFKALLFLAAGSFIHSCNDNQDIRKFGNIIPLIPITSSLALTGTLAISGIPYLSGFYSKESIIELALTRYSDLSVTIYASIVLATIFTCSYSFFSYLLVWLGLMNSSPLSRIIAHESDYVLISSLIVLGYCSIFSGCLYHLDSSTLPRLNTNSLPFHLPIIIVLASITLTLSLPKYISHNTLLVSNKRNYWDYLYNNIAYYTLYLGHHFTGKLIDKGSIKFFGYSVTNRLLSILSLKSLNIHTPNNELYILYVIFIITNVTIFLIYYLYI